MDNGWVKIHRQLATKGYYKDSEFVHLWVHLILNANHEEKEFLWNGKLTKIKAGQLITGRLKLQQETGINQHKIDRILNLFENEQQIKQETTTKYRLITILNWDKHQKVDKTLSNKRATSEQQVSTNKNEKKDKNIPASQSSALVVELIKSFEELNPACKGFYGNTTQRRACDELIATYGFQRVSDVISKTLPKTNKLQYFPKILTPYQLWNDWAKLEAKILEVKNKPKPQVIL